MFEFEGMIVHTYITSYDHYWEIKGGQTAFSDSFNCLLRHSTFKFPKNSAKIPSHEGCSLGRHEDRRMLAERNFINCSEFPFAIDVFSDITKAINEEHFSDIFKRVLSFT